ncbi:MAG: Gfo/Idh/MocA family protein [Bacteroidales bacterium]
MKDKISRRRFIGNTASAAAGFTILPSYVVSGLGHKAPSDKLNVAGVGVGGMGRANLRNMNSENIVALCDVDWAYAADCFNDYPGAKKYYDWRKMFDEMKDSIDAVVVATADHTHAIIAAHAITMGKHVFVQKPLTHSVYESRLLTNLANEYKVATQMGNQGNSSEDIRRLCEVIWNGEIGEIKEVHAFTNRPIWPQGLERPEEVMPVPDTLDWDLFLGPAPDRPFNSIYTPWNWRGWWDFGTGALGDMACHILDPVFMALKLQYPTKIQASSTQVNTESAPVAEIAHYVFPKRDKFMNLEMPEVKVSWYDGGLLPPRPEGMKPGEQIGRDHNGGCVFYGTKGILSCGTYAKNPWIIGQEGLPEAPKVLRRVESNHEMDWVRACKESPENRVQPSSNFDYSGPLNEMVVMGVVGVRLQDLKKELEWDGKNMKFTNISESEEIRVVTSDKFAVIDGHPHFDTKHATLNAKQAAEEYIKHTYRAPWSLPDMPINV